jgi:hypothetical protein
MRPFERKAAHFRESRAHCLYASSHNLGGHKVFVTLNLGKSSIEAHCTEPRKHLSWTANISLFHVAAMLLKKYEFGESVESTWRFLGHSLQLTVESEMVFSTQHIISFPIQNTTEGIKAFRVHHVRNHLISH